MNLSIDPETMPFYIGLMMTDVKNKDNSDVDMKMLEGQVDELINACSTLKSENGSLRSKHDNLVKKTEMARTRVETMISRLKALEEHV
ncbi:MAG: TIGR02449 family protein [Gammaproteobacteria bacterium]|nr:TIGR02449 family protein [Gammaproteobacteria bacterium]